MSRGSLFVVALALSCGGARHDVPAGPDAALPLWARDGQARDAWCGETHRLRFTHRPADVLLLFDRSESMITEFGDGTRYSIEAKILGELVEVYQDKLRFGFQQFPDPAPCPPGYAAGCCAGAPTVQVGPGAGAAVRAAIAAAAPLGGSTPTAEALRRAREYFYWVEDGVTDRYVLLSTDGRPSCDVNGRLAAVDILDADGNRKGGACHDALHQVDLLVAAGVKVIVLGVGSGLQDDPGGPPDCLEELARRGNARRPEDRPAFFSGSDPQRLETSLQQIFGGTIRPACSLLLESTPSDPDRVAVFIDGREVPRNRNYGWEFEAPDDARRLHFYGEYCRRIDRFQIEAIEVRYGCPPCPGDASCE